MEHLFRMFSWVDSHYPPDLPHHRYRKMWTLGQDDYGNAIPYDFVYFH